MPAWGTNDEMSMNFDLFTTACAVAGIRPPADRPIDGRNILPMLAGDEPSPHEALFFYKYRKLEAVRTNRWKYHRRHKGWAHLKSIIKQRPVLIDLETDANESYNAIDKYPEVAREMENLMGRWEQDFVKGVPR